MEKYSEIHKSYCSIVEKCISTSQKNSGIPAPTHQHFYASILFTKLCTISVSIQKLTPLPSELNDNSHWDYASVASLTRNLIECYLVLFYLCIDKCSKDESDARLLLMNLHDHMSRTKMFESAGEDIDTNEHACKLKDQVTSSLKKSVWFNNLPDKQKIHFLKGNTAFFKKQDEIVQASGGSISEFRFIYRFLSNNTHSYPMGFYRMDDGRGRGVFSKTEVSHTGMCIQFAEEYLNKANNEFSRLFTDRSKAYV